MGIFDSILSQAGDHADVGNLAARLGIDPEAAERAIAALAQSHTPAGDTVAAAASRSGLDEGLLRRIVEEIGGEGSLGEYARILRDNPVAAGLFGKD